MTDITTGGPSPEKREASPEQIEQLIWSLAFLFFCSIFIVVSIEMGWQLVKACKSRPSPFEIGALIELGYYRAVWLSIILFNCVIIWLRKLPLVALWVGVGIIVELLAVAMHRPITGGPFSPQSLTVSKRFIPHPLLQGIPNPGFYDHATHSQDNLRVTTNNGKASNPTYISVYGGSTTYDITVKDEDTWASQLSDLLGPSYFVENHGVPGYSTVEHMIQVAFDFRKRKPNCAIFYVGWNDLRSSNIEGLHADYSDFHLPRQRENLGLTNSRPLLARRSALISEAMFVLSENSVSKVSGRISSSYDVQLSAIFQENVTLIAKITRHFGVTPVFIPQVLNWSAFAAPEPSWWTPFIPDRDIERLMAAMNKDLEHAAQNEQAAFLDSVSKAGFDSSHFQDVGHFNKSGSKKFAEIIAPEVKNACR